MSSTLQLSRLSPPSAIAELEEHSAILETAPASQSQPQEYYMRDSPYGFHNCGTPTTYLIRMPQVEVPNGTEKLAAPTPRRNTFSLTEYTTSPSPTTEDAREKAIQAGIPEDFLLPSGYPDVCHDM